MLLQLQGHLLVPARCSPSRLQDPQHGQGAGAGADLRNVAANEPGAATKVCTIPHLLSSYRGWFFRKIL